MIILGIDTSDYANSIGIVQNGKVLADFTFEARSDSLEKIVSNIDEAMCTAQLYLEDLYGIAVGLGPGSWTGIRIGVTVAKMLAFSVGRAVCGVSSLDVLAYQARKETSLLCPIISVGARDNVYAAFYHVVDDGIERYGDYYVGDVPSLSQMLKEPTIILGPEAESYASRIKESLSSTIIIGAMKAVPTGSAVASLAIKKLEKGESDDVLSLTPLYLKESTAKAYLSRYSAGKRE